MVSALTLGELISSQRKALGLSQKELAVQILREEDGKPISPQYLNDIEHDRRTPSSDGIIRQIARILEVEADYLFFLAGTIPEEYRKQRRSQEEVVGVLSAFRKSSSR
jgi:transcriptional regulator with XRE-family HTH domain